MQGGVRTRSLKVRRPDASRAMPTPASMQRSTPRDPSFLFEAGLALSMQSGTAAARPKRAGRSPLRIEAPDVDLVLQDDAAPGSRPYVGRVLNDPASGVSVMRRFATTFFAVSAVSLASMASSALAAPTASQITTPTGTGYVEAQLGLAEQATAVRGTTTGAGNVDLKCYYGGAAVTFKSNVAVTANQFDTSLTRGDLAATAPDGPCLLRAVPAGDTGAPPPSAAGDPFAGPTIAASNLNQTVWANGAVYDLDLYGIGGSGLFQIGSAEAGILESHLVNPSTLAPTPSLFDIGGGFNGGDLINIDGSDAYVVDSAAG